LYDTDAPTFPSFSRPLQNIHKSNWKLRAIKSILISRATGDNQKSFQCYVGEMKKYLSEHRDEVDAVAKIVEKNHKKASVVGATPRKVTVTKVTPPTAAAAAPEKKPVAEFGPLQPLISKLPPPLQTVPAVAGIGVAVVLLLGLIIYFAFFSGSSAAGGAVGSMAALHAGQYIPASSSASSSNGVSHSSSSSGGTGTGQAGSSPTIIMAGAPGTSNLVTCLLTLLVAAVGGLGYKVNQMDGEIRRLRAEIKKK
jgi:hypothetical protein